MSFICRQSLAALLLAGVALGPVQAVAADGATTGSFAALQQIGSRGAAPVESLTAADGTRLALRSYLPANPKAVLVFFHGAGMHSAAGYPHLARELADRFDVAVYTPDLRGHGESDGPRGHAPSASAVWEDVSSVIALAQERYPDLPLFIGGHSAGAGLALNYMAYPKHEAVDGVVLLSPDLGPSAATQRAGSQPFASVQSGRLLVNTLTAGKVLGNSPAVSFAFPVRMMLADSKLLGGYTVNMAQAVIPVKPAEMLADVRMPMAMWIGADDELIDPLKLARLLVAPGRDRVAEAIGGADHLTILLHAADYIGPWLQRHGS